MDIVVGSRVLSKTPLSSTVFVSSVIELYPFNASSKKKCFLNFSALRRSRHIYLKVVAHPESCRVYLVGKVILPLVCCDKMES